MTKLFWGIKNLFNFSVLSLIALILVANLASFKTAFADEEVNTSEPSPTPTVTQTTETQTPEPSQSPEPTPSASTTPIEEEQPTSSPQPSQTPQPSTSPESTPSGTISPTSTPQPSPSPTASSVLISEVVVGTTYSSPSSNTKVKFNSISGTAGTLNILESSLSQTLVNQLQALSSTVYEITSSMANGSFTYDLTLPYPSGVTGTNFKVFYASDVNGLSNPTRVSQTITDNGDGTFTIHNLNHFTVFVVVDPNSQANCDSVTLGTTPGSTCYTTVQAAVNAASNGDTINVGSTGSPYNETVYVNKQLIINGVGNPSVNAFVLQTTPVTITGITTSVTIETPTNVALTNPVHSGNHTNISITGNGAPNATIDWRIYDNTGASVSGLGLVDSSGNINVFADVSSLADGPLTLFLFLTSGTYSSNTVTASSYKDTIAPAPASNLSITNSVNNSNKTNVSISGNAEAGTTVYWMISDGAGNAVANTTTASGAGTFSVSNIDVSNLNDGTITLGVTLGDSAGNFSSTSTTTATKDVVAPTVSAGSNTVRRTTFTTSASASDPAPSSGPLTYQWTQTSGPGTITFGSANSLNTTVSANQDGTYIVTLTATDPAGNSNPSSFSLVWDTALPVISGLTNATTNTTVTRSATVSDPSPSSGIASTVWTQQSGPGTITFGSPNSTSTTISANTDGTYIVRFTATDNAGNASNQDITFIWDTTNPTVSAGSTPAPQRSTFTQVGSASDATSGIASVSWSQISGPGTVTFGTPNNTTTTVSANTDGTYVIQLTAVDNAGNPNSSTVTFVWDTQNPSVNAGSDVVTNTTFTQNGSATDPAPSSGGLTYAWTKTSGPGNVTFGSASSASTTVSTDADGVYVIRLTVTDAAGNSSFDEFNLTWDTTQPSVSAGTSPQNRNATFTQVGSASDSLSGIASVTWSEVSGPGTITFGSANNTTTTISASADGTYTIQLSATDNAGNTNTSTMTLNWDTQNPTVNAGADVIARTTFTQTGTVTDPTPSSGGLVYSWTQVSGPGTITFGSASNLSTTVTADTDGTYVIQLSATDAAGNTNSDQFQLIWDTVAPTVSAGPNTIRNASFTTSATATDPAPSSGIATYAWTQTSGPGTITFGTPNALNTTISANQDGTYTIQLTVTDNAGNSASSQFTLVWDTVSPTVSAGPNQVKNSTFTQTGTASDPSPSSGGLTYQWTQTSGPGVITFGSANALSTTISANQDGAYVITLTVTDAAGNSASSSFNLTWDTVAPVVSAGPFVDTHNTTFSQQGTVTDPAPSSGIASTVWSKVSGPGTVTFSNPNSLNPTIVLSQWGTYVIALTALDNAGNSAQSTFTASFTPIQPSSTPPSIGLPSCSDAKPGSAPALLSAKVFGNKVLLTWSRAKDPVTYYLIEYGLGHDSYQFGVPNVGNVTEYEIGGLQPGVTYYFRVRAGNGCNAGGEFSNELSARAGGFQTFTQNFGQEIINVTSRALGVREAFALEEGAEDLSVGLDEESTKSAEASASAKPETTMSPSPIIPAKKPADMLRYILIGAGLILLTAGSALYYTTLQKKR